MRRIAGGWLVISLPLAAWDALWAFGVFFVVNDAEGAISDNWSWLFVGPFSFLPATMLGLLCFGLSRTDEAGKVAQRAMWLPIAWLAYGACRFTWLEFFGKGFATSYGNHSVDLLIVALPMMLTGSCFWLLRLPLESAPNHQIDAD